MMRGSSPGPTLLYVTPEKVSSSTQLLVGCSFLYDNRNKKNSVCVLKIVKSEIQDLR